MNEPTRSVRYFSFDPIQVVLVERENDVPLLQIYLYEGSEGSSGERCFSVELNETVIRNVLDVLSSLDRRAYKAMLEFAATGLILRFKSHRPSSNPYEDLVFGTLHKSWLGMSVRRSSFCVRVATLNLLREALQQEPAQITAQASCSVRDGA